VPVATALLAKLARLPGWLLRAAYGLARLWTSPGRVDWEALAELDRALTPERRRALERVEDAGGLRVCPAIHWGWIAEQYQALLDAAAYRSPEAIEALIDHIESFQTIGGPTTAQIGGDPVTESGS
jgi:hypothetical protein